MENVAILNIHRSTALTWKSRKDTIFFKPLLNPKPKPFTSFPTLIALSSLGSSSPAPAPSHHTSSSMHTTLLVEAYHNHRRLKALLHKLEEEKACPLQLLRDDGDWIKDHFWAVIKFLRYSSRCKEILQVFDMWKNIEKARINELNYEKIIRLLVEEDMMEEAVRALREMEFHCLKPCLEVYSLIIHGYARNGKFDDALFFLNEMKEIHLAPETYTYDGLIEAYGKYKMYDEIGMCLKKMEMDGCLPDQCTYNLLIREFSRGGLLKRMEKVYRTMLLRRMNFQPSSLVAMLEAYANFGILDKMERVYRKVLAFRELKEDLVRKVASVYIGHHMFSRLDDLGLDLYSREGSNDTVWCLRLLSHACLLSRKGMDSIVQQMEKADVPWNVTIANIILLAYLKMKDFNNLRSLFYSLSTHHVKPDIITIGILFDANRVGFDGAGILETWRKMGLLYRDAEMNTDPLVLTPFGKGHFLRSCEDAYISLGPDAREKKRWTYHCIIDLVIKENSKQPM
ncbi:hypothetical protein SLA2020_519900 [Shorea laevis]